MEDVISLIASIKEWLTMENVVQAVSYTFFFVTVGVFAWQVYRCILVIRKAVALKKIGFKTVVQSLITLYLIVIALLSAGINGRTGVFWVFSFIGFSLTCIFWIDRASKRGIKPAKLKRHSP
ncbi:hypothetical protein [Domibacillus iocasae]|uniref:Uncharacterized protein n=1 Tax=Domibacillus iocasae TaxID=1714016 RepID=A0A1E7DMG6_9BACI|nr:hypothetical protein [Domibacillus iocasae]OES43878.1 hypothetical protein BA724_12365 [Domibacillus iocasae]